MTIFDAYFGWPLGAVYGNLLASVICVGFVAFRVRARMIRQHAQSMAQAARHHRELMTQASKHHQALKAHIATLAPPPAGNQEDPSG